MNHLDLYNKNQKLNFNERLSSDESTACENSNSEYFDIKIKNKKYPSCYRYNVLIMLAKRLIANDKQIEELNRQELNNKLVRKIIDV